MMEGRYDLAVDLRGDLLSIIEAWWLGARSLIGRRSRGGGFLLTESVDQEDEGRISETDLAVQLAERVTSMSFERRECRLTPATKEFPDDIRAMAAGPYICIAVAAPYKARLYPSEKWVEVIKEVRLGFSGPVLLLGGGSDKLQCEAISARAGEGVHNLAGRTTMKQTCSLISGCRLFAGIDGGLIHIAAACNVPLVQLFGPENPVCFGHYGAGRIVMHEPCPRNPCPQGRCLSPGMWCMARINSRDVAGNCLRLLRLV
jgi:ADP-heptose:LPS heptosyltransferase